MELDYNGTAVVESVASFCNNTVVVTHAMGPTILSFADHPNVTAILLGHYPGQELGNSLIDILYGDVNPSGKLPYTIAYKESDYNGSPTAAVNSTDEYAWQAYYDEELELDYRYFDAKNISVQYEFGYGLSYTTFEVSKLAVSSLTNTTISPTPEAQATAPGGNPALWDTLFNVTFSITNTGPISGAQVAQLYIGMPSSTPAGTPPRQLRGFEKVFLAPNATSVVTLPLMRRDISYWDVVSQDWVIPAGAFTLSLGFSSRDIKLTTSFAAI
jgi:beta-glucosidase